MDKHCAGKLIKASTTAINNLDPTLLTAPRQAFLLLVQFQLNESLMVAISATAVRWMITTGVIATLFQLFSYKQANEP